MENVRTVEVKVSELRGRHGITGGSAPQEVLQAVALATGTPDPTAAPVSKEAAEYLDAENFPMKQLAARVLVKVQEQEAAARQAAVVPAVVP